MTGNLTVFDGEKQLAISLSSSVIALWDAVWCKEIVWCKQTLVPSWALEWLWNFGPVTWPPVSFEQTGKLEATQTQSENWTLLIAVFSGRVNCKASFWKSSSVQRCNLCATCKQQFYIYRVQYKFMRFIDACLCFLALCYALKRSSCNCLKSTDNKNVVCTQLLINLRSSLYIFINFNAAD